MLFKDILEEAQADLDIVGQEIRESLDSSVRLIDDVAAYLINSGGKRFRPLLLLLSARAFGYDGPRIHRIASTLEFIHTATLLHDDVVDTAELRRGQASANVLWGNEATVLVGDFLLARAFLKLVGDGDLDVLSCVSKATTRMAEGEVLQLLHTNEPATTESQYFDIIDGKTAVLFSAAAEVGAILGGGGPEQRAAMARYGMSIGTAFQITDDTIDYLSEDATMGKTQGQDFYDGKVTMPFIHTYANADAGGKSRLASLMQKDEKTRDDFDALFGILKAAGAFEHSFRRASEFVADAKRQIAFLDAPHRERLDIVADFTIERCS